MARRFSHFHGSLNRPKIMMGMDPNAFYALAFVGSFLFASKAYLPLIVLVPGFSVARLLTKKDSQFMGIFLKYLDERDAYTSIPRPSDWSKRPAGWGKGLPW
jgi:type IV secretory pathway VirB3-like protein